MLIVKIATGLQGTSLGLENMFSLMNNLTYFFLTLWFGLWNPYGLFLDHNSNHLNSAIYFAGLWLRWELLGEETIADHQWQLRYRSGGPSIYLTFPSHHFTYYWMLFVKHMRMTRAFFHKNTITQWYSLSETGFPHPCCILPRPWKWKYTPNLLQIKR